MAQRPSWHLIRVAVAVAARAPSAQSLAAAAAGRMIDDA